MEHSRLIQELNQGKHLAHQLRNHLRPPSSSAGILLIDKILRSYEKALSALGEHVSAAAAPPPKDQHASKKRKVVGKWSEEVKVSSGAGVDAPLGDGFSWRKYGQKDILGSKFPRGYFRCSHRYSQGCLATKHVQKSDKDPTIYEITYKGRHTCNTVLHSITTTPQEQKPSIQHPMPPKQEQTPLQHDSSLFGFDVDAVRVKSENLDDVEVGVFRPFQGDHSPFEEGMMESEFGGVLSPKFESNDVFGLCCIDDQAWDSEFGLVSIPNSVSSVPIGDLEEYCTFDNLELFC